jgi:hypothetical protein
MTCAGLWCKRRMSNFDRHSSAMWKFRQQTQPELIMLMILPDMCSMIADVSKCRRQIVCRCVCCQRDWSALFNVVNALVGTVSTSLCKPGWRSSADSSPILRNLLLRAFDARPVATRTGMTKRTPICSSNQVSDICLSHCSRLMSLVCRPAPLPSFCLVAPSSMVFVAVCLSFSVCMSMSASP